MIIDFVSIVLAQAFLVMMVNRSDDLFKVKWYNGGSIIKETTIQARNIRDGLNELVAFVGDKTGERYEIKPNGHRRRR